MNAFLYGAILAFGLIIPLGMQNVFIFNQGITQKKWKYALPSVLTAFVCDALLIITAVLGVSVVVLSVPSIKNVIYYSGLAFLLYMGWVTWRSSNFISNEDFQPLSALKQVYFAASVSLLNPHAILDSVAVIGANSLNFNGHDKWLFTFACLLVSLCWFVALSFLGRTVSRLGSRTVTMKWLNKCSALTIWGVAFYITKQIFIG